MCVCDYVVTGVECEEESVTCCDLSPLHLWSVSCFIPSVCLTQSERAVETLIRRTERERESERERERETCLSPHSLACCCGRTSPTDDDRRSVTPVPVPIAVPVSLPFF